MLHGHSHGKLDDYNAPSMDLRFDVGERVIASTVSVDEYFDELIDKVRPPVQSSGRLCSKTGLFAPTGPVRWTGVLTKAK